MVMMVVLGVALRFVQEAKAGTAAAKLKAMIRVTATVIREDRTREIPLGRAGAGRHRALGGRDMNPADIRLLSSKDLFIIQASLTGESLPVEKFDARETVPPASPLEWKNICFLGTSVESGTATGVVVGTGGRTYLGGIAKAIVGQRVQTSFDKGVASLHLVDDPLHGGDGALGLSHQWVHQAQLARGLSSSPWPWPWA